jgi:hypothetical protein
VYITTLNEDMLDTFSEFPCTLLVVLILASVSISAGVQGF